MLKRPRRPRSRVVELELLPHDVVELILERLPVISLLRFRSVSKNWKSTIDSRRFKERQLICRRESRDPDVLCVQLTDYGLDTDTDTDDARRIELGSSIVSTVRFPTWASNYCHGSCDGLVCLYSLYDEQSVNVVANPATRCHRSFPLSGYQQLLIDKLTRFEMSYPTPELGFGKDIFKGTYKPVWLYNSSPFGLDNATTCEVFDFSTNAWRYLVPASPYRILAHQRPVYLDGSLYWFTECGETKILSFDLHTETFQVVCKAPFAHVRCPFSVNMCILYNRLCVSRRKWPTQVIWSLGGSNTWKKMCSIDLTKTFSWFGERTLLPIAIVDKSKLLLHGHGNLKPLVIHDLHAKSYGLVFKPTKLVGAVYYFQSLFSVLSN